jgi:hypothetical protein
MHRPLTGVDAAEGEQASPLSWQGRRLSGDTPLEIA